VSPRDKAARPQPTAVGDVLEGTRHATLQRSGAALDRHSWRRVVGRRIAERTEVGALRAGELSVFVASAAWAQELSFLSKEILERLGRQGVKAQRIRFRVKTGLGEPRPQRAAPPPRPQQELPAELKAHLARVEDDELRSVIAEAAGLAFARLSAPPRRKAEAAAKQASGLPRREAAAEPTSARRSARAPRDAAARSAPKDRSSAGSRGAPPRKRG
jgi:hypothetical protein